MKILDLKYEVRIFDNLFLIQDCITKEVLKGFQMNKYHKMLRNRLYGFTLESGALNLLVEKINEEIPKVFVEVESEIVIKKYRYVRELLSIFQDSFINKDYYKSFIYQVGSLIESDKRVRCKLDVRDNISIDIFNPFIDLIAEDYDIVVTDKRKYVNLDSDVLLFNVTPKYIEIGPIMYNKFSYTIPELDSYDSLYNSEYLILNYFINKIIDIYALRLNHYITSCDYYPSRFMISLNRESLTIEAKDIEIGLAQKK
ncbi:hypothetical protein AB3329_00930 [Streptococcus sp. H31]|uniref:hypothetical protein n=1 Tax=Streptococcus huangxiaojuni TaxID=3237239 RepID=UPI0034A28876